MAGVRWPLYGYTEHADEVARPIVKSLAMFLPVEGMRLEDKLPARFDGYQNFCDTDDDVQYSSYQARYGRAWP